MVSVNVVVVNNVLLKYFDIYTDKFKWQIIPVYPNSKKPVGKHWNLGYNPTTVGQYFKDNPDANIGLLLGNLVDVEADTQHANDLLKKLVGDRPHPQYRSSRSTHHIFQSPDKNLTRRTFQGIEFRGHNHQSLLPPSRNEFDEPYRWLPESRSVVPAMPAALLRFYWRQVNSRLLKPNFMLSWCERCRKKFPVHKNKLFKKNICNNCNLTILRY